MYQDKKPAVWNLVNKNDNFTVYVSEGGGVKYCIINDQGNEQIVFTHAGRANENMASVSYTHLTLPTKRIV